MSETTIEILITLPFSEEQIKQLESLSSRLQIRAIRATKVEDIAPEFWATADVLYTDRLLPTPEQAPNLGWIQFHWAGISHVEGAPILDKPGLRVTTLSGAAASKAAEFVALMLLAFGHRFVDLMDNQQKAEWPADRWERFRPRELRGSTVGIVGYGSIGRQVAWLLRPFGAQVLATKRDAMHPEESGYAPEGWGDPQGALVHRLYPAEAIRSMARECDFLVITVPLTEKTRNLIDASVLSAMKPTAFLVDVSRGGVVDHAALVAALKEHRLAGAALDVFSKEPLPPESPLWKTPNVILTPHVAGITPFYNDRALDLFSENLQRFLAGYPLLNLYEPDKGY
ncbi:MAG: D-2-hydroxyacid dehydrogenase [Chloroflexota bacterium]